MSYTEYKEEFEKAQKNKNAPYKMFVFDLHGSKKMSENKRYKSQIKSIKTLQLLAKKLQEIETKTNKKILLYDENVKLNIDLSLPNPNTTNPCVCGGDAFVISILADAISEEDIIKLFLQCAKELKNKYTYNLSIGKFETTDYILATEKCYIGYCLAELTLNKQTRCGIINVQGKIEDECDFLG